jgi:hypothetical protein
MELPAVKIVQGQPGIHPPAVSVVIASMGRPSLEAAVRSVLDQDFQSLELVVVLDGPAAASALLARFSDPRLLVLQTETGVGGNSARAIGTRHCRAPLVAFLDDDDEWLPTKLSLQVAETEALRSAGTRHFIVACRADLRTDWHHHIGIVPRRLFRPPESVGAYLFRRRQLRPHETVLCTSMLLCDRELLEAVALRDLQIHSDWDFLLRATAAGARLVVIDEVLIRFTISTPGRSLSSSAPWRSSTEWFLASPELTPTEVSDGIVCFSAVLALRNGDRRGALAAYRRAAAVARPSWRATTFLAVSVLLPRRVLRVLNAARERVGDRLVLLLNDRPREPSVSSR